MKYVLPPFIKEPDGSILDSNGKTIFSKGVLCFWVRLIHSQEELVEIMDAITSFKL